MDSSGTKTSYLGEPSLEELLSDPIIQQVMERDGLTVASVRGVFLAAARRLDPPATDQRQAA